jgi:hypothetical protein
MDVAGILCAADAFKDEPSNERVSVFFVPT